MIQEQLEEADVAYLGRQMERRVEALVLVVQRLGRVAQDAAVCVLRMVVGSFIRHRINSPPINDQHPQHNPTTHLAAMWFRASTAIISGVSRFLLGASSSVASRSISSLMTASDPFLAAKCMTLFRATVVRAVTEAL